MWFVLALLSAVFAALTSILAKVGIDGVNSNLATAIRTIVVLVMAVFDFVRIGHRCLLAVLLQSTADRRGIQSCSNR